ncbi:VWA domain-containing protein [Hyphomicrobium methylovorum]|uniref:vWA domain-containing protein n=1 Tax=Hyphomicrobium methylovorum TaxID=84 RepID=UPI0015E62F6B|nr:vWA domain-containing protein [Hyphomicrobium methylovorum]MBA2125309.1 VWA domain-containing protein [Hyphomicrobium methylovorum]
MTLAGIHIDRRMLLLLAALVLTALAIVGFHVVRERQVANALAVLDITGSMNTRDMGQPPGTQSRLEASRKALIDMMQNLPCESKLGLGLFTERVSFLLFDPVEICGNYDALEGAISEINWRMAWQADSYISRGLFSSIATAESLKADVIFLTDGHEAPPLRADMPIEFDGKPGEVKGLIVGVGGTEKSPIPKYDDEGRQIGDYGPSDVPQDNRIGAAPAGAEHRAGYNARNAPFGEAPEGGEEHLSSVRTEHLETLAQLTGLTYVELQKTRSLAGPLLSAGSARSLPISTNMAFIPALLALGLLVTLYALSLFDGGIRNRRWGRHQPTS